jgi:5-methylcytosine-specific restriction endonuclease McrA
MQCGRARDGNGVLCTPHMFQTAARRWLGDSSKWEDLRSLLESQGYRCAYTGAELFVGKNASIDHIEPRARGGADEISNLQWVSWEANRAKTDLSHDEFLSMCRAVARRFPEEAA